MTLMNHKTQEEVKSFKEKKQQYNLLHHIMKDNAQEEASEKAHRVRSDHIEAHEKRKMYFLDKLKQFKDLKERKLTEEIRGRERQEYMVMEMEEK